MIISNTKLTPYSLLNGALDLDAAFFHIKARFQLFGDSMNTGKSVHDSSIVECMCLQANTNDCMFVLLDFVRACQWLQRHAWNQQVPQE
jgi:hypothetical protein